MADEHSNIDLLLQDSEETLKSLEEDLEFVRKMNQVLDEIVSSQLFSNYEKKVFEESYEETKVKLRLSIEKVVSNINQTKDYWIEKQKKMHQLYQDKLLTEEVAKLWDQSLKKSGDQIEKLEKLVQFYDQKKSLELKKISPKKENKHDQHEHSSRKKKK